MNGRLEQAPCQTLHSLSEVDDETLGLVLDPAILAVVVVQDLKCGDGLREQEGPRAPVGVSGEEDVTVLLALFLRTRLTHHVSDVLCLGATGCMGRLHCFIRNLQDHAHQCQQLLEDIRAEKLHHILGLFEVGSHNLWVGAVLRIVDEDVVVVQLLGEAAFVSEWTSWLVTNIQATSVFFGGD